MSVRVPAVLVVACLAVLSVGACESSAETTDAGFPPAVPSSPTRAAAAVLPVAAGLDVVPAASAQVLDAVRSAGSKVVIVNLWATWCTPCRQEFPDLLRVYRAYRDRGVTLLLVSGDMSGESATVRDFLATQGVDFRTFLKSEADEAFINALDPAWNGALPATFVYDGSGHRLHSFLGPVTYESLEHEIAPLVGAAS